MSLQVYFRQLSATDTVLDAKQNGIKSVISNKLNIAKSKMLIQAYSFTSAPIAKARAMGYRNNKYLWGIKAQLILMRL